MGFPEGPVRDLAGDPVENEKQEMTSPKEPNAAPDDGIAGYTEKKPAFGVQGRFRIPMAPRAGLEPAT